MTVNNDDQKTISMDNSQSESIDAFLKEIGVGRRPLDDKFFEETHEACRVFQRTGVTVEDDEELCHNVMREFPCNVYGCKARFRNLIDFEIHYNGSHRYVCQECKKIRPNARLLDIHIQESHDSFFCLLAEKQPMYQCYVSECDSKLKNPAERRNHCITVHKFPKNFRYDCEGRKVHKPESKDAMVVEETECPKTQPKKTGLYLDKNQRMKMFQHNPSHRGRTSKQVRTTSMEDSESIISIETLSGNDNDIVASPQSVPVKSALAFIPRQVLQKSYSKVLTKNKNMQRNVLETETMMDLAESLPE